jgi:hypothetical protein
MELHLGVEEDFRPARKAHPGHLRSTPDRTLIPAGPPFPGGGRVYPRAADTPGASCAPPWGRGVWLLPAGLHERGAGVWVWPRSFAGGSPTVSW